MKIMRSDEWVRRLWCAFALVVAGGVAPAGAQSVFYDQGSYQIQTTLDERFLGRFSDGTPITDGGYLYEGQFKSRPPLGTEFGINWTRGVDASATDLWQGSVIADPDALITRILVQPVWDGYVERYHGLYGTLRFEIFSDAGFANSLYTDSILIERYTHGPISINLTGVTYLGTSFAEGLSRAYLRFTQTVEGRAGSEFASGNMSHFHSKLFEVTADTISNPNPVSPVPEPESYAMLIAGLGVLVFVTRRRKMREAAIV